MFRYIVGWLFLAVSVVAQAAVPVCKSFSQQGREVTLEFNL